MNAAIGEKSVELGGRTYVLRPTFRAYSEIESLTGKDTLTLAAELTNTKPRIRDVAIVVWCGYKASDLEPGSKVPSLDEVGELIFRAGYLKVALVAAEFLVYALQQGGDSKKKEEEASPATP